MDSRSVSLSAWIVSQVLVIYDRDQHIWRVYSPYTVQYWAVLGVRSCNCYDWVVVIQQLLPRSPLAQR